MITLGFQILNIIKESFASDELEGIPYDFEEGYDFIIKKTESGGYPSYAVGTKFSNKQRALTGAELETAEVGMIDLTTLLPKNPGVEKVQAQLDAEMNGEEYDDGAFKPGSKPASKSTKDEDEIPFVPSAKPSVTEAATESEEGVDDMLAQIRSRRKNRIAETSESE